MGIEVGTDMGRIEDAHVAHYREHGYVIVERFLDPEALAAARSEIDAYLPGWLAYADDPRGERPPRWDETSRPRANVRFPFPGRTLNAITLHPELRRFASLMCGSQQIFCEQSDLTYKCRGHFSDRDQHMHMDYPNHTLAYPPGTPDYWQTTYLLYYTDVTASCAPTAVCSWQHYAGEVHWPPLYRREDRPALYEHEQHVIVPAGSLLAYSVRTFHRGTAFLSDGARVGQFISYSPARCPWLGIVGWAEQAIRPEFRPWIEQASPQEREVLGFPPPGHPYWSEESLRGISARYPGMNLTPYRNGMEST